MAQLPTQEGSLQPTIFISSPQTATSLAGIHPPQQQQQQQQVVNVPAAIPVNFADIYASATFINSMNNTAGSFEFEGAYADATPIAYQVAAPSAPHPQPLNYQHLMFQHSSGGGPAVLPSATSPHNVSSNNSHLNPSITGSRMSWVPSAGAGALPGNVFSSMEVQVGGPSAVIMLGALGSGGGSKSTERGRGGGRFRNNSRMETDDRRDEESLDHGQDEELTPSHSGNSYVNNEVGNGSFGSPTKVLGTVGAHRRRPHSLSVNSRGEYVGVIGSANKATSTGALAAAGSSVFSSASSEFYAQHLSPAGAISSSHLPNNSTSATTAVVVVQVAQQQNSSSTNNSGGGTGTGGSGHSLISSNANSLGTPIVAPSSVPIGGKQSPSIAIVPSSIPPDTAAQQLSSGKLVSDGSQVLGDLNGQRALAASQQTTATSGSASQIIVNGGSGNNHSQDGRQKTTKSGSHADAEGSPLSVGLGGGGISPMPKLYNSTSSARNNSTHSRTPQHNPNNNNRSHSHVSTLNATASSRDMSAMESDPALSLPDGLPLNRGATDGNAAPNLPQVAYSSILAAPNAHSPVEGFHPPGTDLAESQNNNVSGKDVAQPVFIGVLGAGNNAESHQRLFLPVATLEQAASAAAGLPSVESIGMFAQQSSLTYVTSGNQNMLLSSNANNLGSTQNSVALTATTSGVFASNNELVAASSIAVQASADYTSPDGAWEVMALARGYGGGGGVGGGITTSGEYTFGGPAAYAAPQGAGYYPAQYGYQPQQYVAPQPQGYFAHQQNQQQMQYQHNQQQQQQQPTAAKAHRTNPHYTHSHTFSNSSANGGGGGIAQSKGYSPNPYPFAQQQQQQPSPPAAAGRTHFHQHSMASTAQGSVHYLGSGSGSGSGTPTPQASYGNYHAQQQQPPHWSAGGNHLQPSSSARVRSPPAPLSPSDQSLFPHNNNNQQSQLPLATLAGSIVAATLLQQGLVQKGVNPFAFGPNDQRRLLAERFKTQSCRTFDSKGRCKYSYHCMFAHGKDEMRDTDQNLRDGLYTDSAIDAFRRTQRFLERRAAGLAVTAPAGIVLPKELLDGCVIGPNTQHHNNNNEPTDNQHRHQQGDEQDEADNTKGLGNGAEATRPTKPRTGPGGKGPRQPPQQQQYFAPTADQNYGFYPQAQPQYHRGGYGYQ